MFYKAEIISRAGKSTGNYPDWFNNSYHHLENKKEMLNQSDKKALKIQNYAVMNMNLF